MLKKTLNLVCLLAVFTSLNAQKFKKLPESDISRSFTEKHIRFLASDALLGRKTGEQGNNAAAAYIAEEWRSYGIKPAIGNSFFQTIPFVELSQPQNGMIRVSGETLKIHDDFLVLAGNGVDVNGVEAVSVGYGWVSEDGSYDDYKDIDVKGKIVVTQMGAPDTRAFREMMQASLRKDQLAKERGAVGIIEMISVAASWEIISDNLAQQITTDPGESGICRIVVLPKTGRKIAGEKIDVNIGGIVSRSIPSSNVIGIVEGSNPKLKNEYVILSAHYDHIGFREAKDESDDNIFNGARDNAVGVSGLMAAAKSLVTLRPERSILLIAFTGEELGLLGSRYYADNPVIPLKQCIFNLNIDGAGYNNTSIVTGFGVNRTGAEFEIKTAVEQVGLKLADDPAPEQGLFDRSDNVSFAAKGIPAPTFSLGFTAFDDEIMRFYHKEADEVSTLDLDYCHRFVVAYSHAARLIANRKTNPRWETGDKYEAAAKILYGY